MRFKLECDCDSAAFEDDPDGERVRILKLVAQRAAMDDHGAIYDSNGNYIGSWGLA